MYEEHIFKTVDHDLLRIIMRLIMRLVMRLVMRLIMDHQPNRLWMHRQFHRKIFVLCRYCSRCFVRSVLTARCP